MKKPSFVFLCLLLLNLRAVADEPADIKLNFPNAPVADVLHYYGTLIGQQVVADNTVEGSLTVETGKPVSKSEAATLIETALFLNGFSLVDSADGGTVKVLGVAKGPRTEGVPIYTSPDELPKRDRVVSYLVHTKSVHPAEAANFLVQYAAPYTVTSFTPGPAGALVITSRSSRIPSFLKLLEAVDVPAKEVMGQNPLPPIRPVPLPPPNLSGRPVVGPAAAPFPAPTKPSKDEDAD